MSRITLEYIGFDDVLYYITFDGPIEEKEVMAELDWMAGSSGHSFTQRDLCRLNAWILQEKLKHREATNGSDAKL